MTTNETPKPRKRNHAATWQARKAKAAAEGTTYYAKRKETAKVKPTTQSAAAFQAAFDYFNRTLWKGQLPQVLITLRTFRKSKGYFSPNRFVTMDDLGLTHEIGLDPRRFIDRTEEETLGTLVHEMAHLWQEVFGTPSRGGYHNAEWATEMKRVGLQPSDTGLVGGKETGEKVTHYIVEGGPFQVEARKLIASGKAPVTKLMDVEGFFMAEVTVPVPAPLVGVASTRSGKTTKAGTESKQAKRVKYTCPECSNAVWGRSTLLVMCAGNDVDGQAHGPELMLA